VGKPLRVIGPVFGPTAPEIGIEHGHRAQPQGPKSKERITSGHKQSHFRRGLGKSKGITINWREFLRGEGSWAKLYREFALHKPWPQGPLRLLNQNRPQILRVCENSELATPSLS
jgi:hypothetical protein